MARTIDSTAKTTSAQRIRQATRERREQEKQELSQTILHTAGELFLEQGYEHFSLRQVAERIGYAPGTIYLYFKDKDEVLSRLASDGFARFEQVLAEAAHSETEPLARLRALGKAYITFGLQHPAAYQLMFVQRPEFLLEAQQKNEDICETEEDVDSAFRLLVDEVTQAMQAGVIRQGDIYGTCDALWAMVHGIVTIAIRFPDFGQERLDSAINVVMELLVNGLRP